MNKKLKRHFAVLAALVVILALGVIIAPPDITGTAVIDVADLQIEDVDLEYTLEKNASLVVDVRVSNNASAELKDDVVLLVNGKQKDVAADEVFRAKGSQLVSLEWRLKKGAHTLKVKVASSSAEKLIKVTEGDEGLAVEELPLGSEDIPEDRVLDFSGDAVEYQLEVESSQLIKLVFADRHRLLEVKNVTDASAVVGGKQISPGSDAVFDFDRDGKNDIKIILTSASTSKAQLTVQLLYKPSAWDVILSFWWLALLILAIFIAAVLMRLAEKYRTKHHKRMLNRVTEARKDGVISKSLYKKAKQAIKKKLKP